MSATELVVDAVALAGRFRERGEPALATAVLEEAQALAAPPDPRDQSPLERGYLSARELRALTQAEAVDLRKRYPDIWLRSFQELVHTAAWDTTAPYASWASTTPTWRSR